MESYLDHHADKLVHRFDAASYVRLTEMMNAHDVGRGRGGVRRGPRAGHGGDAGRGRVVRPAVPAGAAGGARGGHRRGAANVQVIDSPYGHDGFLIEAATVSRLLGGLLDTPGRLS